MDGLLCTTCNNDLGYRVEADVKSDPGIRLAVEALRTELPRSLIAQLTRGQDFRARSDTGDVVVRVTRGDPALHLRVERDQTSTPTKLDTPVARRFLEAQALRAGALAPEIAEALRAFDAAPDGAAVQFPGGFTAIKRSIRELEPTLNGELMSELLPLKVAYEFLAIGVQGSIFARQLDPVREAIRGAPNPHRGFAIELLRTSSYAPTHALLLRTGEDDHVIVDVVLFGWHVYRVHFLDVALQPVRFGYEVDLTSSTDRWVMPE